MLACLIPSFIHTCLGTNKRWSIIVFADAKSCRVRKSISFSWTNLFHFSPLGWDFGRPLSFFLSPFFLFYPPSSPTFSLHACIIIHHPASLAIITTNYNLLLINIQRNNKNLKKKQTMILFSIFH